MSDQSTELKDQISYIRGLAEQGRRGPVLGGAFLAAAGLIYGAASFVQWGIQTGRLPPFASIGDLWIAASLLFAAIWTVLFLRLRRGANVAAGAAQFAFGMVWAGSGLGIIVMLIATLILNARLHDPMLLNLNALTAFAFYGAAWSVSAVLARRHWMFAVSAAAFAITLLLALVSGTPAEMAVFGAGLLVTLFAPGVKLMFASAG
jgi:hypothetical protein